MVKFMRSSIAIILSITICLPILITNPISKDTMKVYAVSSGNILMFSVLNQNADGVKNIKQQFSSNSYTIVSGDYLEYDLNINSLVFGVGAIDFKFSDGTYLTSLPSLIDENGVSGIPNWYNPTKSNMYKYATNKWYHVKIKLPSGAVGKVISKWLLYNNNTEIASDYVSYYDNIVISNGSGTIRTTGYNEGALSVNTTESSTLISKAKLQVSQYAPSTGNPSGDVLKFYEFAGTNTGITNKYIYWKISDAGSSSYIFKSGDYIEYDVFLNSPWSYGLGGIDIATSGGYFRDASGWADQNGLAGHPATDLTLYAFNKWYHRKLQVPSSMIGKTISYWDLVGENDENSSKYQARYDNIKVTDGGSSTFLTAYSDSSPSLNTLDFSNDATRDVELGISSTNVGNPSGDILRLDTTRDTNSSIPEGYTYIDISNTNYTIQNGDRLEYDMKISPVVAYVKQYANVDLKFTDNTYLRDTVNNLSYNEVVDQNGIPSSPYIRTDWFSGDQWYHRTISLTAISGKTINQWLLSDMCNDSQFTFTSYFDNIKITSSSGQTQATGYSNGNPSTNTLAGSSRTAAYALTAVPYAGYPSPNYQVVTPTYTPNDVAVVSFDVTSASFGAVGDGTTDDTVAFQKALYAAEAAGGGVVYAPNRQYSIYGHLFIPAGVTLRGDWKSPDNGGLGVGTILKAYENQNNESGVSFITLANGSTVEYLSVFYPNQSYASITPYPYTFRYITYGSQMIRNVTMINSYNGIGSGDYSVGASTIENVFGTILRRGIRIPNSWDIERWENIKFIPDYWSNSGLPGAPSGSTNLQTLKNYMVANAEGIVAEHIDGIFGYNIYLRSFKNGIVFKQNTASSGSTVGVFSNLDIDQGNIGILADSISEWGVSINNSSIKANTGSYPYAVSVTSNFNGTNGKYISFNKSTIGGAPHTAVLISSSGNSVVNFQNCTFND